MKKIVFLIIIFILLLPLAVFAESDTSAYEKANGEMSEISNEISGEEATMEQSKADIYGSATGFDKFMIGFMFVILSFSALCMPIYIVLDFKKKREKRAESVEKRQVTECQDENSEKRQDAEGQEDAGKGEQ